MAGCPVCGSLYDLHLTIGYRHVDGRCSRCNSVWLEDADGHVVVLSEGAVDATEERPPASPPLGSLTATS
jgi:hypothetical protein